MSVNQKAKVWDSNCHPTIDGTFLDYSRNVPALICNYPFKQSISFEVEGIVAVGFLNIGGFDFAKYSKVLRNEPRVVSKVAPVNADYLEYRSEWLSKIKNLGYSGIKFHPKHSELDHSAFDLMRLFQDCEEHKLFLMICTWEIERYEAVSSFLLEASAMIKKGNQGRLLLAHAVGDSFDELSYLSRRRRNILLDTSFRLIRGERNAPQWVSREIKNDGNLSFGTDWPDYTLQDYSEILQSLQRGLSKKRFENYTFRNLQKFLKYS